MVAKKPKLLRYSGLKPASSRASAAARGASRKSGTRCELLLRKALWKRGLRYRVDDASLPGRPDIVFSRARIVVFCDGDFWHGRNLAQRLEKLAGGHNAPYWVAKIQANVDRDRRNNSALEASGWRVLRFWETDIKDDVEVVADRISHALEAGRR
jgi:DNA mismatch endonuclease (patch repair protein)